MGTPTVTIFIRHSPGCNYVGDEFAKRCNCRKHLRWSQGGKQYRKQAGTRSWAKAEEAKANLAAQLSGKSASADLLPTGQTIDATITIFLQDKKNQDVTAKVLAKYTRELARLKNFCEGQGTYVVTGLTRELLTGYAATWPDDYPASSTRSRVRDRLSAFLRFCYQAEWLPRLPSLYFPQSRCELAMYALNNALGNPQRAIAPLVQPLPVFIPEDSAFV